MNYGSKANITDVGIMLTWNIAQINGFFNNDFDMSSLLRGNGKINQPMINVADEHVIF